MPGRRSLLASGCACCAIALVPCGAARAAPAVVQQHLELARQAAGSDLGAFGMGGTWTAGAALVAESWGPQQRGRGAALMQMGLPCGTIVAIGASALVAALHSVLWNTFKRLAAGASATETTALFSGTARRVYRLPDHAGGQPHDSLTR